MNAFRALVLLFTIASVNCGCPHGGGGIAKRRAVRKLTTHGKARMGSVLEGIFMNRDRQPKSPFDHVSVDASDCDADSPYQTIDASCNNLKYPDAGRAATQFRRLLPAAYGDGVSSARTLGSKNQVLPNPRLISSTLHRDNGEFEEIYANLLVHFGQFFAHDLTEFEAEDGITEFDCPCPLPDNATELQEEFCLSAMRPRGDSSPTECFIFVRAHQDGDNNQQVNDLTSFVDASNVYGSDDDVAESIRSFDGGLLNTTEFDYLPFSAGICDQQNSELNCFLSGDLRTSENLGLSGLHLLFVREHNRIAVELAEVNPSYNDERLYQEARRIVMATMQHIVYNEWLPAVIGPQCELLPLTSGFFEGYDQTVDPSITNVFATSGFRFGHTLIRQELERFGTNNDNLNSSVALFDIINDSNEAFNEDLGLPGIDAIFLGMIEIPTSRFDTAFVDTLQNRLFEVVADGETVVDGNDLMVRNVLRGRDMGLQPYYKYREYCSGNTIRSFCDLKDVMTPANIRALRSVYDSVFDIDVFPGSLHEFAQPGAVVGATTQCILSKQFFDLKRGDRFYYENSPSAGGAASLGAARLAEIRKVTMARLICDNYNPHYVQPKAFFLPLASIHNQRISCDDLPRINFSVFSE